MGGQMGWGRRCRSPIPRFPRMLLCPHLQGCSEQDRVPEMN